VAHSGIARCGIPGTEIGNTQNEDNMLQSGGSSWSTCFPSISPIDTSLIISFHEMAFA
jgi:hypothetical protein